MNLPAGWVALAAVLALLLGLWLVLAGRGIRRRRGLGGGKTVSLDRVTLTSRRLGLTGRPDRLIKADGTIIVEEWKSARTLRPWHRIENDEALRAWVLDLAGQIRAARASVTVPIAVNPKPGQCRPCGIRGHCGQARS